MRLTVHTDYALRVLIYLALHRGRLVTSAEVASAYGISGNHLTKVVNALVRNGWVASTRGRGGGLELAREPGEIAVGEVVRASEEDFALVQCQQAGGGACVIQQACVLRGVLDEALHAFNAVLDGYTLADLAGPSRRLVRLLDIG